MHFKNRFKIIEKYHTGNIPYRKEHCENCVNSLEKCPFGLMLPNIRFDNPVRLFKTDYFQIGQSLRPWRQAHDSFQNYFSLCHAPCSAVGRFPEPFTRSLSVGDADTDRHIITIWGIWTAVRREKQRSRMQGCKNAKTNFLHPCTVEWKATTKGKNLFRV